MYVTFKEPTTGKARSLKVGFSWFFLLTSVFYGIPQYIMGIWQHGLAMTGLGLMTAVVPDGPPTSLLGIVLIGAAIFYGVRGNAIVAKALLAKGWQVEGSEQALQMARLQWGVTL